MHGIKRVLTLGALVMSALAIISCSKKEAPQKTSRQEKAATSDVVEGPITATIENFTVNNENWIIQVALPRGWVARHKTAPGQESENIDWGNRYIYSNYSIWHSSWDVKIDFFVGQSSAGFQWHDRKIYFPH